MAEIPPALGAPRSGVTGSDTGAAGGPDPSWSGRENECGRCRRRLQEAAAGGGCRRRRRRRRRRKEKEAR